MRITAISLWQPHASLVAFGEKPFETRHWQTKHRGLLAIHAAKHEDHFNSNEQFTEAFSEVSEKHDWGEWYWPQSEIPNLHFASQVQRGLGAVLCVCDLLTCVPTEHITGTDKFPARFSRTERHLVFGDFTPGRWAWVLQNVRRFKTPIPATGHQGLWKWEAPEQIELADGTIWRTT